MDNKKSLMTAGIVGVGGVALAYLGHSYLTKKEEPETDMDKAADTVEKSSFFETGKVGKIAFLSTDR